MLSQPRWVDAHVCMVFYDLFYCISHWSAALFCPFLKPLSAWSIYFNMKLLDNKKYYAHCELTAKVFIIII
jgi:hypothetical protein